MADSPLSTPPAPLRKVLLMIDTQVNMLDSRTGVPSAEVVGANIARALDFARSAVTQPLIIHIRNTGKCLSTGEPGDPDAPGTPGWQLAFPPLPHEPVLDKTKNNAFAGTKLGELVDKQAEIVIVGMQSDFCVRATAGTALGRGNTVFLVEDAHATYDRPEAYSAGSPVRVTAAAKVEKEIESELEEAGVHVCSVDDLPHIFADEDF